MNKRTDELKKLRIDVETEYLNFEFIELLAKLVTHDLVTWANKNIYHGLGGELSLEFPLGAPNALALVTGDVNTPYKHVIKITTSMLLEIYRDAFVFPLISKRIALETQTISDLNDNFIVPFDERYMFSTGVPILPSESTNGVLRDCFINYLKINKTNLNQDKRMSENDVACRFVMFELVLTWVFFHELGHLVQRHHMLKFKYGSTLELKIEENNNSGEPDISGQAREILADIEGLDLTLKYMKRKKIFNPQSLYLLMSGINCMYQRFYQNYDTNLDIHQGTHPHPVIRNEFSEHYILQWMIHFLERVPSEAALPLSYLSIRSSIMCGQFWAIRVERFDGGSLPTYMDLQSQNHKHQRDLYMNVIRNAVLEIITNVKHTHIMPSNSISLLEKILTEQLTRNS